MEVKESCNGCGNIYISCGCKKDQEIWEQAVEELPMVEEADRQHMYILPDNTMWVLNHDGTELIQVTNSGSGGSSEVDFDLDPNFAEYKDVNGKKTLTSSTGTFEVIADTVFLGSNENDGLIISDMGLFAGTDAKKLADGSADFTKKRIVGGLITAEGQEAAIVQYENQDDNAKSIFELKPDNITLYVEGNRGNAVDVGESSASLSSGQTIIGVMDSKGRCSLQVSDYTFGLQNAGLFASTTLISQDDKGSYIVLKNADNDTKYKLRLEEF